MRPFGCGMRAQGSCDQPLEGHSGGVNAVALGHRGHYAPDSRAGLCYLLGGAEAVEPSHQRGVQACGDC